MTTLVGWVTCVEGDATGVGITLGGIIAVFNGASCGMGGGCYGCCHAESRGIDQGSQLENSSRSLVIAVSFSWQIVVRVYLTAQERNLRAWTMRYLLMTVG